MPEPATELESKLKEALKAELVTVLDISPTGQSCGKHIEVSMVVSEAFTGLTTLARHRLINEALSEELKTQIHALTIKKCLTPSQLAQAAAQLQSDATS